MDTFLLRGHSYTGPFNALDNGPPKGPTDSASRTHDYDYADIGYLAYFTFNDADRAFLQTLRPIQSYSSKLAQLVFDTKKYLLPSIGGDAQDFPRENFPPPSYPSADLPKNYFDDLTSDLPSTSRVDPPSNYFDGLTDNMVKKKQYRQANRPRRRRNRQRNNRQNARAGPPVAFNLGNQVGRNLDIKSIGDGSVRIRSREMLAVVTGSPTFAVENDVYVSVSNAEFLPRASTIATLYDRYRIESATIHYKPTSAATKDGLVLIQFDPDLTDPQPTDRRQMLNARWSVMCQSWVPGRLDLPREAFDTLPWYLTGHAIQDEFNNFNNHMNGRLFVATSGQDDTSEIGDLIVEVVFTLRDQQAVDLTVTKSSDSVHYSDPSAPGRSQVTVFSGTDIDTAIELHAKSPLFTKTDESTITGADYYVSNHGSRHLRSCSFANTTAYALAAGTYMVQIEVTGTGLDPATAPTAGDWSQNDSSVINLTNVTAINSATLLVYNVFMVVTGPARISLTLDDIVSSHTTVTQYKFIATRTQGWNQNYLNSIDN
jgi:hypothetical protein